MLELKFRKEFSEGRRDEAQSFRDSADPAVKPVESCCAGIPKNKSQWTTDTKMTGAGLMVSTDLSLNDCWEHIKCRISAFRNDYTVNPGLYATGEPDNNSDVLVSANYKFSFDMLRRELKGLDVWILVLDTKGINVWCAAGKGTFGTDELIRRIGLTNLSKVVDHRRIIVPQLGAPGISAHIVKQATGFRVCYGPVRAKDLPGFIEAGYKATEEMRKVNFSLSDRLVLTPMEINPAMKKYLWYSLMMLGVFGLQPAGIFFKDAVSGSLPFLVLGLIAIFAGAFLTPLLLPVIPFRSFAIKGWIAGMFSTVFAMKFIGPFNHLSSLLLVSASLFFPLASSYIALQFTGSTPFTGMSGVKKELKIAIPVYLFSGAVSLILLIVFKLGQWGVI